MFFKCEIVKLQIILNKASYNVLYNKLYLQKVDCLMNFLRDKTKEESLEAISKLYKQITDVAGETALLYDAIEDFFFQDIDYQKIKPIIPLWMIEAGRSPESSWDKSLYEKFRSVYKDPISNRIIHWADIQGIISAFQDRVMAVKNYLEV